MQHDVLVLVRTEHGAAERTKHRDFRIVRPGAEQPIAKPPARLAFEHQFDQIDACRS